MKNQRVLVIGGAGFIGSNLAEELARENEVVILDDLRRVKERMRTQIIIDGRRVFEPGGVRGLGFVYRGVGAGDRDMSFSG